MVLAKMKKPNRTTRAGNTQSENGTRSNMRVVVRVRPPNSLERGSDRALAVRVMDEHVLVFDPNEETEAMDFLPRRKRRELQVLKRRARDLRFMFDRVFDHRAKNTDVFEHTTKAILDGVLNGYNCSVFAYGATGAGKTHTMIGSPTDPGVIFLTMVDLYKRIQECQHERLCDVAVSYLEVYNENIRDLLMPGPPLAVREDPQKGVCVSKLTLHQPRSAEELLGMLEFGNNNRTQHPTDANAQSSRSHAVFQVFVRQKDRTAGLQADVKLAKMSLIDLAGSERATVTKNRGARFREGANINRSLLALGNCINALADNENKPGHIPYRDSKLTRLLKDSLGGNCRTVMIAAISPSSLSYEDTYNTLKYADRAKSIKSKLVKNVLNVDLHVSRYAKIVEDLRTEISELKIKLQSHASGSVSSYNVCAVASNTQIHKEAQRLKSTLKSVIKERVAIRKDVVDIQAAERDVLLKAYRKERNLDRMQLLCTSSDRLDKSVRKTQKCLSATKTKQKQLSERKMNTDLRLVKNSQWLEQVQEEMKELHAEKSVSQYLQLCQAAAHAELESSEMKRQCYHLKKYAQAQEKDTRTTERLVSAALGLLRKQFVLLQSAGLASSELTEEYEAVVGTVERNRELAWADQSSENMNMSSLISFHSIVAGTPVKDPIGVRQFDTPSSRTVLTPRRVPGAANSTPGREDTRELCVGSRIEHGSPGLKQTCISLASEFDSVKTPSGEGKPCVLASKTETFHARGTPREPQISSVVRLPARAGLFQTTAAGSPNAVDLTPGRISTVTAAATVKGTGTVLLGPGRFLTPKASSVLVPGRTTAAGSPNAVDLTPGRISTATAAATVKGTGAVLLGPGRFLTPKASSVLVPGRSLTPRSKIAWAQPERSSSGLLDYCSGLSLSGVQPAVLTPTASSGKLPSDPTRDTATFTPCAKSTCATPLRDLSLNCQKNIVELHRVGLPSVFDRPENTDKPARIQAKVKTSKDMLPQRIINPLKENTAPRLKRSSSISCVNQVNPNKVKKHMSGLRRALSSANFNSSRNVAPRSMRKERRSAESNRPRWQ